MTDYPEHEKLRAIAEQSQACGEFIEWLSGQGLHLMRFGPLQDKVPCHGPTMFGPPCDNGKIKRRDREYDCSACDGKGYREITVDTYYQDSRNLRTLLAEFFEIDQDKIEQEKRAMLDELRAANV